MNIAPSHSVKLSKLEAIRGFAAFYVTVHHTTGKTFNVGGVNIANFFRFGQEAVILFFILSGIVIQYSFSKSRDKSFRTYFIKRLVRIYVPLTIVFISNYLVLFLSDGSFPNIDRVNLFGNLLMLQDTDRTKLGVLVRPFLGNLPLWSLSYEWWFYMLFFGLNSTLGTQSRKAVYCASLISAGLYVLYPIFILRVFMYLAIWWIGTDIAQLYIQKKKITIQTLTLPLFTLVTCVCFLIVNIWLNSNKIATLLQDSGLGISPLLELRHFVMAIVSIMIALLWRRINWIGFNAIFGIFEKLAPISYVLYISHYFLISRARYLDDLIDSTAVKYIIYTIICLGFSYLVELIIYPYLNKVIVTRFSKRVTPLIAGHTFHNNDHNS